MKLANAYIVIGTAASTYPCPWCISHKEDFKSEDYMFTGGDLRTLGQIRENAFLYQSAANKHTGKTKLSSAPYVNCEHPPLCDLDDSTDVLSFIPPIEFHFHLGVVNKLYDHLHNVIKDCKSSSTAKDWSDSVEVKRPKNHGGEFNGNQCCYLLAKIDWIENLIEQENLNSHITVINKAFVSS